MENLSIFLEEICGAELIGVCGLFFEWDGQLEPDPIELELSFSRDNEIQSTVLRGRGTGGMAFERKKLTSVSMGEAGNLIILNLLDQPFWIQYAHRTVVRTYAIRMKGGSPKIGLSIVFDNGNKLSVANLGDEITIFTEISSLIVSQEGLILDLVNSLDHE